MIETNNVEHVEPTIKFPDVRHDRRLPYARWTSIMRKVNNYNLKQVGILKKVLANDDDV